MYMLVVTCYIGPRDAFEARCRCRCIVHVRSANLRSRKTETGREDKGARERVEAAMLFNVDPCREMLLPHECIITL